MEISIEKMHIDGSYGNVETNFQLVNTPRQNVPLETASRFEQEQRRSGNDKTEHYTYF